MNITIITSSLPYPLKSGGAQAQHNFINKLRAQHSFSIICPENGINKRSAFEELKKLWPNVEIHPYPYYRQMMYFPFVKDKIVRAINLKMHPRDEHFQVERALRPYGYDLSPDFLLFVLRHIKEHKTDLLQVDFYPYLRIADHMPRNIKKLFVQHEIRYIRNERLLSGIQLTDKEKTYFNYIKQEEIYDLNKYDRVITLTQVDKDILANNGVHTPISVSPAAVNSPIVPFNKWNGKITFIGGYSHIPNQEGMEWFVHHVVPQLDMDNIHSIDIIGNGWPQSYFEKFPKIRLLGFVDNLQDAVQDSLLIVPILTGSGMRMKILDAAAMGIPFVTTSVGVEGLSFHSGKSCLVADTPMEFAASVNRLISDRPLRENLSQEAQSVFKKNYSIEALSEIRNQIYMDLAHNTPQ